MTKIAVGILGATGLVGMQAVHLLANHPFFEVAFLVASKSSSGKIYSQAVVGKWAHDSTPPDLPIYDVEEISRAKKECRVIFSCLKGSIALIWDEVYAKEGFIVISNASSHRGCPDVPVMIPEINADHLKVLPLQRKRRGWKGVLITKPNCSIQSYMIPLEPLHRRFGVKRVMVTTLQALSGAGFAGRSQLDMDDNVIPFIAKEEEKTENEPLKIWGRLEGDGIVPTCDMTLSAHCTRVSTSDGHLACVSVEFNQKPTCEEILAEWREFAPLKALNLPSSPDPVIHYLEEENRPQVRLDRLLGKGMAVSVGRLRPCHLFDMRFVALSHNTIRGAAGGSILTAELVVRLYPNDFKNWFLAASKPRGCTIVSGSILQ